MDMEMPVMDGLAATRLIRDWEKVQRRSATPIVALTAHVFSEHRTQCAEAGCNGFLAKPIKKKTLLEMLWKHAPEATLEPSGVQPAAAVAKTPVEEKHKSFTVLVDDDLMNVVGDYLKQIQEECLQMKAAVEANNRTRVIQLAQGLKESGSGYGLDRVSFLGQQIMDQAQNGGGPALLDSIESLSDYLAKVQIVSAHAYTVTVDAELEPVIDDYVRAVKQDCRSLVKALRQRDIDTVAGIGHDLKGSGEGYGLTRVSEIGKALCEHARTKNMSGLVNETKSLAHYIQNVVIVSA
jgi:CheY-like chemotaxis protein